MGYYYTRLKVKNLGGGRIPSYHYEGDAGLDLYTSETVTLEPGEIKSIPTRIALEIPKGYVGLVWDKSGLAMKRGLKVLGGVVDSGYRGEIIIGMVNLSKESYRFARGEKVAQMVIQEKEFVVIEEVEELEEETDRGEKGFGSSGK